MSNGGTARRCRFIVAGSGDARRRTIRLGTFVRMFRTDFHPFSATQQAGSVAICVPQCQSDTRQATTILSELILGRGDLHHTHNMRCRLSRSRHWDTTHRMASLSPSEMQSSTSRITLEQVRHVAKLSRLALDESHLQRHARQLESILEYVARVTQFDVENVAPTAHALPLSNVFRDDNPGPALSIGDVLKNAPQVEGRFFKVPKVIGGDEDSAG